MSDAHTSILDQIEALPRKKSVFELAYDEPDPPFGIAAHVWEAHEEAKRRLKTHGTATAEITFKPDIAAFELVPESRDILDLLRSLGPQAKITIHF